MTDCPKADYDVAVVGAGVAGLAAATTLAAAGKTAIVLEAGERVGGRAWTAYPPSLGGVWFDMGALLLHAAERNPLVAIAERAGEKLRQPTEMREERTFVGTRLADAAELADYEAAWDRFTAKADELLSASDAPLAAVAAHLAHDPWALTVEAWEGPVICAADAADFSLRDWRTNALSGSNLVPEGGIGAFVARRLAAGLDIRLGTPVLRIALGRSRGQWRQPRNERRHYPGAKARLSRSPRASSPPGRWPSTPRSPPRTRPPSPRCRWASPRRSCCPPKPRTGWTFLRTAWSIIGSRKRASR